MNNLRLWPAQFNPKESAGRQRHRPLLRMDQAFVEEPESYFLGKWDDRHLLNVPGPFYGAETDTCCDGPPLAPLSLLTDELGSGFVWRQPRNDDEAHALMTGASSDPFNGFGWDGDEHWTVALIRSWWADRAALEGIVDHLIGRCRSGRAAWAHSSDR
jgi:hypothetical protein